MSDSGRSGQCTIDNIVVKCPRLRGVNNRQMTETKFSTVMQTVWPYKEKKITSVNSSSQFNNHAETPFGNECTTSLWQISRLFILHLTSQTLTRLSNKYPIRFSLPESFQKPDIWYPAKTIYRFDHGEKLKISRNSNVH